MSDNEAIEMDSNIEDADNVVTLNEVLQYENQIIEDTAAVLGAMNDKNCSYVEVRRYFNKEYYIHCGFSGLQQTPGVIFMPDLYS